VAAGALPVTPEAISEYLVAARERGARMKRLVVFDLDGTLAKSKSRVDPEMASLLHDLLGVVKVAVISGGAWPQFTAQLLSPLPQDERLVRLSLLPTCGTKFFAFETGWTELYSEDLAAEEKVKIKRALKQALEESGFAAGRVWGEIIEDRGTQITLSALGQEAPSEAKSAWDPDFSKRKTIQHALRLLIPEFSVRLGGSTSIDVTRFGIDKGYGIGKLRDILSISFEDMLFVGDALFVGGNDRPVKDAGVVSVQVRDPDETKRVVETLVACLERS
jgi:phosphomannomutase